MDDIRDLPVNDEDQAFDRNFKPRGAIAFFS
jgi:hypothetical protein